MFDDESGTAFAKALPLSSLISRLRSSRECYLRMRLGDEPRHTDRGSIRRRQNRDRYDGNGDSSIRALACRSDTHAYETC